MSHPDNSGCGIWDRGIDSRSVAFGLCISLCRDQNACMYDDLNDEEEEEK